MKRIILLAFVALSCCAPIDYDAAPAGKFKGAVTLIWVGANQNTLLGDGDFIYVPMPGQELTFTRHKSANPSAGAEIITPEAFYTDGGSVPRAIHALPGFNAWAYGPAYVVHDWAFVARKCLNDGDATDEMKKLKNMTFRESARLMAETIKSLVKHPGTDVGGGGSGLAISSATAGPISYRLWTEKGACARQKLSSEHAELVRDYQGRGIRSLKSDVSLYSYAEPRRLNSGGVTFVVRAVVFP